MTARMAAALILLGACSPAEIRTPPAPSSTQSPPPDTAASAADVRGSAGTSPAPPGDPRMIALLSDLVLFLSREPLSIADVVAKVGPIKHDPGPPQDIELTPSIPGVRVARLFRAPDTGKPDLLTLELASPIPVASLQAAFGAPQQVSSHRGMPRRIIFSPPGTEPHWTVAIIAEIPPGATPIEDEAASTVTLRRDAR